MMFFQVVISPELDTEAGQGVMGFPALPSGNRFSWRQKLESWSLRTAAPHHSGRPGRERDHPSSTNLFMKSLTPPTSWMGDFQPYNTNPLPVKCLAS